MQTIQTISNNLKQFKQSQTILKQSQTIQTIPKLQLEQQLLNMPLDAGKAQDKAMG